MKSVLNAVNEGVITFNSKLKIVMINRFALNLWGYSRDQILGEPLTKLIAKPYSSIIQKYSKNYIKYVFVYFSYFFDMFLCIFL